MNFEKDIYSRCPIFFQTILLNIKALELYWERYGRKFWRVYNEFEKNQWLPESDLHEYQNEKLRILVRHAYENVPYYHEKMKKHRLHFSDIKTKRDLYKFPVLTRKDVKRNSKQLVARSYPRFLLRHGHTSGTTGSPLDFSYDVRMCVVHLAAVWRQRYWGGLQYGEHCATLQGRVIVPLNQKRPPFWRKNYVNNQVFLSSFHLTEKNLPHYFDMMEKDRIRFLEGYPSNLYILAIYLQKTDQIFPLKAVFSSSETLFDYQREAIEGAFQCKMYDYYGMAERTVFASECSEHSGHHLNLDYGITEFLDGDNYPVSEGRMGKIVATGLHNFAMPFIRYETNDSGSIMASKCSCGRGFPLMDDVTTKCESIITLPDGRLISPSVLTHPFKPMHNIKESQIIQDSIDKITVKIVKGVGYTDRDEEKLITAFRERLGGQVRIGIEYVKSIPKTKGGKLKWVVSQIEPRF